MTSVTNTNQINIDRDSAFDPTTMLVGFDNKRLEGFSVVWQDPASLALKEIDLLKSNIRAPRCESDRERSYKERKSFDQELKDVIANGKMGTDMIRLDAKAFKALWEDKTMIPESWRPTKCTDDNGVCFEGTVFANPDGYRCVIRMYWFCDDWYQTLHFIDHVPLALVFRESEPVS